jgi:ABC-type transporter MlaC component
MSFKKVALCFSIIVSLALISRAPSFAQEAETNLSPDEVVRQSFDALSSLDVEKYASFMHPDEIKKIQERIWPSLEHAVSTDTTGQAQQLLMMLNLQSDSAGITDVDAQQFFANLMNMLLQLSPGMMESYQSSTSEIIGDVPEGDTLRHVVSRVTSTTQGLTMTRMDVTTVRKYKGGWKLVPSGEMQGLAMQMERRLGP